MTGRAVAALAAPGLRRVNEAIHTMQSMPIAWMIPALLLPAASYSRALVAVGILLKLPGCIPGTGFDLLMATIMASLSGM